MRVETLIPLDGSCERAPVRDRFATRPLIGHCGDCRGCPRKKRVAFPLNALLQSQRRVQRHTARVARAAKTASHRPGG